MAYSLATLWHDRTRYWPAILAVAFSALLIALQCGLLLGLFSITSAPIDLTNADIWVGDPGILSVDVGRPIPEAWIGRLAQLPDVEKVEPYLEGFTYWAKPGGGTELVCVLGASLEPDSLGAISQLTPELRTRLTEPGSCVVDRGELARLGIRGIGDTAEIAGRRVRVVGLVDDVRSLVGPYVFTSLDTARPLLRGYLPDQTTFLLAKTRTPEAIHSAVKELRSYGDMSTFSSSEFSFRTRMHWLTTTKAGIAMGCAAALGLFVGAVITAQTLRAAVMASLREFAVLRALGIPRRRLARTVLAQSFWVGIAGISLALPIVLGFDFVADDLGAKILMPGWLLITAATLTLGMALISGVSALRSLRHVQPAALLR